VSTYVLIHGSWHASWCWSRLSPKLENLGHQVLAPTLIGLGELANLATPETGLTTHIQQIELLLQEEGISDAILVGHSYGGMILTGVAELAPERISTLVYLDALIPEHGQSCFDLMPGVESEFRAAAIASGCEWLVPPMSAEEFGVTDPKDAKWVNKMLTPMPIMTHSEKVEAETDRARSMRRVYILCERFGFQPIAEMARTMGFQRVVAIDAGHEVQLTHPEELLNVLLDIERG